jgi:hypothetical protein
MIKKLTGLTASLVALASTASAEVKINENLSLDGYAIGTFGVTEGTAAQNDTFLDSGDKMQDAVKVALNGVYGDFTGRVSLFAVPNQDSGTGTSGLLDAYLTYKVGAVSITGGKFNNYLGYESFDSPNNAFITFGPADNIGYVASYATGAKVDYVTEAFSVGVSARDSLERDGFFKGDADYSDDIGYEAYVLFTGIEKLTVFIGGGYENTDDAGPEIETYNIWAAYALTDKLTLVGSWARTEDFVSFSYTLQASYAVNDSLSLAARYGAVDGSTDLGLSGATPASNYSEVGVASTYTLTSNFAIKGEVNKKDFNDGASDTFFYAVQGLFKF